MATTNQNNKAPRPRRRRRAPLALRILAGFFKVLGTMLLIGICTGAIMACFAVVYVQTIIMPQAQQVVASLNMFDVSQSSTMYYTDKETGQKVEMLTLRGTEDRVWVEYDYIPKNLINATVAIEDKRFYNHQGVDWIRTAKGVINMFTGQDIQGGSTITQQLIKNTTEYDDVTVKRKVLEIFTALEFERTHSKNEILEWYLNYIYLGDGCNGVYTAALNYFGKELQDLTLSECASLISITNNPSLYNPYRYPENNIYRRNLTLDMMADPELGYISQAESDAAKAESLDLKRETGTSREQEIYTWYEDQVITDVKQDLMEKYQLSAEVASNLIYYGGLHIETCFDPEVQAYVDAVYNDRNSLVMDSATGQEVQSAITIVENSTGNVVAMAGGIGEKEENRGWNRATDTKRPPGSSIKPLSVYAPALDMGVITPATVFDDIPVMLLDKDGVEIPADKLGEIEGSSWPNNSYNYYKGLSTVYEAVEISMNTIAVKVLRDLVTPELSYQYLTQKFGITSLEEGRWVGEQYKTDIGLASLALGGLTDGVSTYEMAAAYAAFANNGMYKEPRTYTRVVAVDINGKETVLLENKTSSEAILKESTVYYMNTMLEGVVKTGTGTAAQLSNMTVAGKTGTTTSKKDNWFAGYTPYYTAAVWVGYDQQERLDGSSLGVEMWKKVMGPLHEGLENKSFQQPEDLVTQQYCKDSGLIATEWCAADPRGGRVVTGTFINGDQPREYCTVHVPQEVCTESSHFLLSNGRESAMYHLAGEHCPAESVITVGILDYTRVRVKEGVVTRDDVYLKSWLETPENGGVCDIHLTAPYDPSLFNPFLPETWPVDDPNFNINDSTTWPIAPAPEPGVDPGVVPEDGSGTTTIPEDGSGTTTLPEDSWSDLFNWTY